MGGSISRTSTRKQHNGNARSTGWGKRTRSTFKTILWVAPICLASLDRPCHQESTWYRTTDRRDLQTDRRNSLQIAVLTDVFENSLVLDTRDGARGGEAPKLPRAVWVGLNAFPDKFWISLRLFMTTGVYLPGARGKRRGFSPAAAARPLDRTRVMRIVARGECLPKFCLTIWVHMWTYLMARGCFGTSLLHAP